MEGNTTTRVMDGESPDRADDVDVDRTRPADSGDAAVLGGRYRVRGLLGRGGTAELVEGGTLADTMRSPSSVDVVAGIGADVASGLAHVHERGIVHRDLKPANVLMGVDGRVVLSDFGIARLLDVDHGHTATGFTVGTAAYFFAPEQVTGGRATTAVDIYALALVLLEALTGQRVYPGPPSQAALARLHTDPLLPAGLPRRLQVLLRRMTDTDPAARPSAAEVEVEVELRAVADEHPHEAPPQDVLQHEARPRDACPHDVRQSAPSHVEPPHRSTRHQTWRRRAADPARSCWRCWSCSAPSGSCSVPPSSRPPAVRAPHRQ